MSETPNHESNPFARQHSGGHSREFLIRFLFLGLTYFIVLCTGYVFFDITRKGLPALIDNGIAKTFTQSPQTLHVYENEDGEKVKVSQSEIFALKQANDGTEIRNEKTHSYSAGGILGPLVGTILLVAICVVVAMFIGISTAVYLNEYSTKSRFINIVRLAILNLAGVPSIVFGLFGFMFFVLFFPVLTQTPDADAALNFPLLFGYHLSFQGWGSCVLAGGCTLAAMVLPVIITASEESLKAVPMGFREASLALGATQWQTIRKAVLPFAFPGILTASILGITRVAGETAPIMFTAAVAHKDRLPWQDEGGLLGMLTQSVQAMPYHIYTVSARIPQHKDYTQPMQYVSVFVFMLVVMLLAGLSVWLRARIRRRLKW